MTTLCRELKKIIDQLRGSRNMFGYRSTVANQLYLFYCFGGKIYFSDKINAGVKFLWCVLVFSEIVISYIAIISYLWLVPEKDIMMMMNICNVFGVSTVGGFGFPLMSYLYADHIEAMIQHVDKMLMTKATKQKKVMANAKAVFASIMGPFIGCNLIYISICFFDVALCFEEEKVQNYLFYMLPVFLIQEFSSYSSFFLVNAISTVVFEIFIIQLWSILAVILYWITVCRNELVCVREELDTGSVHLSIRKEKFKGFSKVWDRAFERSLRRAIGQFQEITVLVDYLREFIETAGSFLVPVTFFYGIAVLHLCLSADLLFVLKLKYLAGYLATAFAAFQFYWVGENLNHSIAEVSMAVYFTPWYWSSKVRKNVYLLLRQTQAIKELTFMKVYGLMLKNFTKYLNGVFSYTNFLRKLTSK